ncbi:MAG: hypothetical protein HN597_20510 [Desulfobacula sp.]|jgi:hypothetical protein|uniref:hypothetical protein n=1 Tax=Desulfobacula sp. TaxID=2593537 RepID=UPI0039B824DB|nr:hypothetical protein [Desulfobacula sp.]
MAKKLSESYTPYQKLWSNVLLQAIFDLTKPKGNWKEKIRNRDSALVWFNSHIDDINSFIGICENLGIDDPDDTREKILNLKRRAIKERV